jgi:hypothetical protein
MWRLEALWRMVLRNRTEWRVFHGEMTMECRIVDVSGGAEIRYVLQGQPYHSFRHISRVEAQDEARRKRVELIERGWSDRARTSELARL